MSIRRKMVICLVASVLLLTSLVMGAVAQEESILDSILKAGKVRVGIDLGVPRRSFRDNSGNPAGYEVDIAQLLADKLGVELEVVEVPGAARVSALVANKADIIMAGFTRNLERSKSIAFCEIPYMNVGVKYQVRPDSPYQTIQDIQAAGNNVTVGYDRGGTSETWTKKLFPDSKKIAFETVADAYLALKNKVIDVASNDSIPADVFEELNPGVIRNLPGVHSREEIAAAVQYGDFKWWHWCNLFFYEINVSGENAELYTKWFGGTAGQLVPWIVIR